MIFGFLTVHGYLFIFGDVNLTVHSLVHKESKSVVISRQSLIIYEIKDFDCFYF
jgi:hypothetical protein